MQLESTENFPTHYQRLFHFASEHFDNQEKDFIIKFALDALNLKDETIISILEENELHLLEKVFQSSKEGSGNLDCFMKSTDPILAKLAFQLKSLLKPADLQAILESELSPEEKKAILEKCMAISMHLGKQAQKLLQSTFEKEDIANLEEAFDDILRTGLANFFQSAYDEEAICRGAGNHRGDLVFYNHLMASIFPLLIGQGQVINITMARFIEASLFGLEDSSKDDVPHWLVEEQLRSLLQRVQDSAELRSILNGIECNLDPQSPGLEAVRLQFGLPPDREVNVTQAQLATLMAIGLNMRQGNTPTCNADASIMRLEPEEMAGAVSSFLRHGVMKCVQVDEEEGLYPFNHSHMIPAGNNVPLHHENLSYRVNVNGDLECGNDTVPLWEMPAVRAACNALGITNAEESIKDVLKRMEFSDTSFQELQIMEFLQELSSQVEKIDSTYLSAFERAYSAFHAIEENLAIRLVQGATLVQNTFSNVLMLESFYNMIFDHFDQTTRLNETKFIEVFNGQVKFIFRSQEHLGYRFGGFVPYLVHTNENGNYRLERLQKGSKGWIVVKEKLEEAIPEKDRSKWTQNALLKLEEFSNGDQEEICGGPKSLSGVGWVFQNLDLDQFRLKGSKPFGRLLDKLRNLEGQRLKENPFKRYKMNSISLTSDHDLNWLPGHPTIQGLIDTFRPGEDENMQSVIERELINPGNEMREKELSEDELDRLFAILDDLKQEYFPNWSSEQISAFKEQIDNVKNMNIYSFLRILELSSFKDVIENEKKFYIRFDWLISNAFNPEGKSIVLADTNWHDETGSPVIISVRHNIRTNLPEIWVTDEFGKIIVAATDFFRDQYFSV